ncbi:membrane protein [Alicyclobacillus cellulosilyticus]|uniref:Membrane protein n=1 Tax=Alicyclobacillus cellulosilyticus TaxID=1003997 RepID=A0A917KC80_9BACL|nr:sodium:calcium antiporter [Alicyclobacillus cellulosilyticus]GGJ06587.1 membrane protein [Alicyclobacillus cellulosilyticus]
MHAVLSMLLALAMVLFGAELFTNAVEWLGHKLRLGQSAVGSVFAALGTALPEAAVPVTAIAFGQDHPHAEEVGIGGILGAPFLLATLGSLMVAVSLYITRQVRGPGALAVERSVFQRDMTFFLIAYALTLSAGCVPLAAVHAVVPWLLVGLYAWFLILNLRAPAQPHDPGRLHPLYLQWKSPHPSFLAVLLQLACALCAIVGGAQLLTDGVEFIASWLAVPPFVLSALLVPLTTELPETFNSVVWIRQGKDSLAIGNITGAMVFQSTLVPALGMWMTAWNLSAQALLTGGLTLAASALIFGVYRLRGKLTPDVLIAASLLYWILPLLALADLYAAEALYWGLAGIVAAFMGFAVRAGLVARGA